ncbi:uncharacterized protein LOC113280032 [Papaver somniferum]|uniref:uncharacterized protein LOC113280032 n=1 Tax=Papaver somniferum TaxID=3469 RepID=UPI000E6FEA52|nr:uncharacterized protein LOC113280032 [Papaver somniferum]
MSKPRTKYAINRNNSSDDDPELVEVIRNRTREVQEQSEAFRIAQEEEMGQIRGTGSKSKGININDPPPRAEEQTHEEPDSDTPTEQEGGEEERIEEQSGGKEEEGDEESDKEIREVVQEQEGDPKGKGQKKEVPKKKKGDHMPDDLKMLARGPDDPPLGIPTDGGNLLWGYKGSWAGVVYNTTDHKHVVRLMNPGTSVSKMRQRPLIDDELIRGEVPEVVDLVNSTGLLSVVNNLVHLTYDRPLCSAFAERYYGETDTLHLPFGEMTITPNGAKFITGLSIEGKAVKKKDYAQELDWDKIYAWTKEVFQWDEEKTKNEMLVGKAKRRIFHLSRLRSNFIGTKKLSHEGKAVRPQRIIATDNAYVLYILRAVIFPDVSGARVNANFIQLLQPFDKIQDYSWGTAILAHSLMQEKERRLGSQSKVNIMGLCFTQEDM